MGTVSLTTISDGTTADAADVNNNLTAITDEVNGNLDSNNIAASGVGTNQLADDAVTAAKLDFVGCRVSMSSDQTVTSGVLTKLDFDTEEFDVGSNWDTTNKRFTAPVTGYYQVSYGVQINNTTADTFLQARIYVNGADYARGRDFATATNQEINATVSSLCLVTAGQYIEGYCNHNSGANEDIDSASDLTFLSIQLVGV